MQQKSALVGLIPARAGNTHDNSDHRTGCRAHPRSRGEHEMSFRAAVLGRGSSPLARGTPTEVADEADVVGLIPARAGNTARHTR